MMVEPRSNSDEVGLLPVTTWVVWVGCVIVGTTGLLAPVVPRNSEVKKPPPVIAQFIHVDLSQNVPAPPGTNVPPAPAAQAPVAAPPIPTIEMPSAMIAFAVPTSAPSIVSSAPHAATVSTPVAVEQITYGQGEGQQPKPQYPLEAELNGEHGTVLVRYTIAVDGSVTSAEAIKPCPYPLLNQSAVRTVRDEWRFRPGPIRIVETPVEYRLKQN